MSAELYLLEVASLVVHRDRPKSFGYVDQIESDVVGTPVYVVQWCDSKIASGPPERCLREELIATECDGCGENLCWCGVGR